MTFIGRKVLSLHQIPCWCKSSHITPLQSKLEQLVSNTSRSSPSKLHPCRNFTGFLHRLSQSSKLSKITQMELTLCPTTFWSSWSIFAGAFNNSWGLSKSSQCLKHLSINLKWFQKAGKWYLIVDLSHPSGHSVLTKVTWLDIPSFP